MRLASSIVAFGFVLASVTGLPAAEEGKQEAAADKSPIEVKIAIPVHHGKRTLNEGNKPFHVLITNTSTAAVKLWTDRFSWGYDNLSFELVDEAGNVTKIAKAPRSWRKNYPDWLELAPGESYVLAVDFFSAEGQGIWEHAPAAGGVQGKPRVVKLRAVYGSAVDNESIQQGVWAGRVESPLGTYEIW